MLGRIGGKARSFDAADRPLSLKTQREGVAEFLSLVYFGGWLLPQRAFEQAHQIRPFSARKI